MPTVTKTLHHIGWIPNSAACLDIIVYRGRLVIRRDEHVVDIVARVSIPSDWRIVQNTLRQTHDMADHANGRYWYSLAPLDEIQEIEILVPTSYRGGLKIETAIREVEIDVDCWTGGDINIHVGDGGRLQFGPIAEVGTLSVATFGHVSFEYANIDAKSVVFRHCPD